MQHPATLFAIIHATGCDARSQSHSQPQPAPPAATDRATRSCNASCNATCNGNAGATCNAPGLCRLKCESRSRSMRSNLQRTMQFTAAPFHNLTRNPDPRPSSRSPDATGVQCDVRSPVQWHLQFVAIYSTILVQLYAIWYNTSV